MTPEPNSYDAVIVVSFGGPEGPDDVLPFLEQVTRGRDVPPDRLAEVAAHYDRFGGVSPINAHTRRLVAALEAELGAHGPDLPVYWGNRNWHPFLADTLARMADDGVGRALAFVTSAFGSYPGCRQYLDDIAGARLRLGPSAPVVDKLRLFFNHPGFIEPLSRSAVAALDSLPAERRAGARLVFSAHSLPVTMAATCPYEEQLAEAAGLVAGRLETAGPAADRPGADRSWELVFQSRSGPPRQPWLEPDVGDRLEALGAAGVDAAVVVPLGFVCDHMEVVYDLDVVARQRAEAAGVTMARAATVGDDPQFVAMIRELIDERTGRSGERRALGRFGPWPDACPEGHCPAPSPAAGPPR